MEITIADVLRYYIGWKDTDERLITGIKNGDVNCFYAYLKGMKVIRNFKKGSYKEIFKVVHEYVTNNPEKFDIEKFSTQLCKYLAKDNKKAIVAASKILWVFNRDEIIIQDSKAKEYLKKISKKFKNDYTDYCKTWEEQYLLFKPEYLKVVKKIGIDKQDNLFNEDWFIRRTFDTYLWNKGKAEEKNKSKEKK